LTLKQRNNNNIVAIDINVLGSGSDRSRYCGKAVNIWFEGRKINRPFVVWDGCAACIGGGKIDFSREALMDITPEACVCYFTLIISIATWSSTRDTLGSY
jgi:hypothetical protein